MELDKRIRSIVDILTVINSDMGGIIGKTGYFGNSIMDFKRLDTCEHGEFRPSRLLLFYSGRLFIT